MYRSPWFLMSVTGKPELGNQTVKLHSPIKIFQGK